MKNVILLISFIFQFSAFAQNNLSARIEYVYIGDNGKYSGGVKIYSGTIKTGEIIQVKDDYNKEFNLKVIKILNLESYEELKVLTKEQSEKILANITLQTLDEKPLNDISGGFNLGASSEVKTTDTKKEIATNCKIDGKTWHGKNYYYSSSYLPKGSNLLNTTSPVLIISFKALNEPDDTQINITVDNVKPSVGKIDISNFEFGISGSESGDKNKPCLYSNWLNGQANTKKTSFYLEITQWEDKGDYIIISGKYSGKLYGFNPFKGLVGSLCKDELQVSEGEFKNLKVKKIN